MSNPRLWVGLGGVASLAIIAALGPSPASATDVASGARQVLDIDQCKPQVQAGMPGGGPDLVQLSFMPLPERVPSTGEVNVTVVMVDFPDDPAKVSARSYFDEFVPQGLGIIEDLSYGQVSFTIDGPHGWFRMPRPSTEYGYYREMPFESFRGLVADAVAISDAEVDYSDTDAFIIVMPPTLAHPGFAVSPAFLANAQDGVRADGNVLRNGTTIGTDWPAERDIVVAHEILHTMGLVDLYKMTNEKPLGEDTGEFVGTYSIMSVYGEQPPPLFGWERWVRSWIRDDQVSCLGQGVHDMTLDSLLAPQRNDLMSVVPLGGTRYLSLEGRASTKSHKLTRPGVIPYVVDPTIRTGEGPIRVPQSDPGQPMNPLAVGAAMAIEGVGIEVLGSRKGSFDLRIHVPAPAPTTPGQVGGARVGATLAGRAITWSAPLRTGWTDITGYEFRWGSGSWQRTTSRTSAVPAGQSKRPQVFQVRAVNSVGPGPAVTVRVPAR